MRAFVDLKKWVRDFQRRARQTNDAPRLKLAQLEYQGWRLLQRTPEQALTIYLEGASLARQLHEPHWELYYEYWCCEVYLYYLALIDQAEVWAVRNFVKVQQLAYKDCPAIGRIYLCLIDVLYFKDAEGDKDKIEQMLSYLEENIPLEYETYARIVRKRAGMFFVMDDWEPAAAHGKRFLDLVQDMPFHKGNACGFLAAVAYYQKRPQDILDYSVEQERTAREAKRPLTEGLACVAQAYAWSQLHEWEKAKQLYEHGLQMSADTTAPHGQSWYNYVCGYQEAIADLPAALQLRDRQLEALLVRNLPASEADCRLARLRLFGKMEEEAKFKSELEATRQVLARLKSPLIELDKLKRIEAGDYS